MHFVTYCVLQQDQIARNQTLFQDIRYSRFKNARPAEKGEVVTGDYELYSPSIEAGYRANKMLYV